jgi:cytochrome d ubiquinol oxidase subunit II
VTLSILWFCLLAILLTMYAILDGFDLGVGVVHMTAKTDEERRLHINAIGPVWDGNEVWLVTFGGALLGAFPEAFALIFSTHYIPTMVLLMALVFRAVALEFRSKSPDPSWRKYWDVAFSLGSTAMAFLFGVMVANSIVGLPIDVNGRYVGSFGHTISLFSIMVGCMTVSLFALHGTIFLIAKTENDLQRRLVVLSKKLHAIYVVVFILVSFYAIGYVPHATHGFMDDHHLDWVLVALNVALLIGLRFTLKESTANRAFLMSALHITSLTLTLGAILFPNLVVSSLAPEWHLTIYNACSSQATLANMARVAAMGTPLALIYTAVVYWLFRGKVQLDETSY